MRVLVHLIVIKALFNSGFCCVKCLQQNKLKKEIVILFNQIKTKTKSDKLMFLGRVVHLKSSVPF